jgi:adenosine deaminase
MRQLDPKDTENLAEIAWRYKDKGVAGFDLAGPEYGFRSKTHKVRTDRPSSTQRHRHGAGAFHLN